MDNEKVFQNLCNQIGYQFRDKYLLRQAFVHPSCLVNSPKGVQSYQRLEFVGDAVIELLVSERLYELFPEAQEGALTNYRCQLVNNQRLADAARRLHLGRYILFTKMATQLRDDDHVLACVFEALAGAVFIDCGGWLPVRHLLGEYLLFDIEQVMTGNRQFDPKSWLQTLAQDIFHQSPVYELVSTKGPDHDRIHTVKVLIAGVSLGQAQGQSRKEAEKSVALQVLNDTKDLTSNLPFSLLRRRDISSELEFRRR